MGNHRYQDNSWLAFLPRIDPAAVGCNIKANISYKTGERIYHDPGILRGHAPQPVERRALVVFGGSRAHGGDVEFLDVTAALDDDPCEKSVQPAVLAGARAPDDAHQVLVNRARFSSASSGGLGHSASPLGAGRPGGRAGRPPVGAGRWGVWAGPG
ncbi:hypothetical protein NKH12_24620, partial [Mesorhizobium sp. M1322]